MPSCFHTLNTAADALQSNRKAPQAASGRSALGAVGGPVRSQALLGAVAGALAAAHLRRRPLSGRCVAPQLAQAWRLRKVLADAAGAAGALGAEV